MRTIASALQAALDSRVSTLGWAIRMTRRSGAVTCMSTTGEALAIDGSNFPSENSFIPADPFIEFRDDGEPATAEITIPLGTFLTLEDVNKRLLDDAEIEIWVVDWSPNFTAGENSNMKVGYKWYVAGYSMGNDGVCRFDIYCQTRKNQSLFLDRFGAGCKNDLGDSNCGVDVIGLYSDLVTVIATGDAFNFYIGGSGREADWYNFGALRFENGDNQGFSYTVLDWNPSTGKVKVAEPLHIEPQVGDIILIHAGCNWTRQMCQERYTNIRRYRGFDYLPAEDEDFGFDACTPPTSDGDTETPYSEIPTPPIITIGEERLQRIATLRTYTSSGTYGTAASTGVSWDSCQYQWYPNYVNQPFVPPDLTYIPLPDGEYFDTYTTGLSWRQRDIREIYGYVSPPIDRLVIWEWKQSQTLGDSSGYITSYLRPNIDVLGYPSQLQKDMSPFEHVSGAPSPATVRLLTGQGDPLDLPEQGTSLYAIHPDRFSYNPYYQPFYDPSTYPFKNGTSVDVAMWTRDARSGESINTRVNPALRFGSETNPSGIAVESKRFDAAATIPELQHNLGSLDFSGLYFYFEGYTYSPIGHQLIGDYIIVLFQENI